MSTPSHSVRRILKEHADLQANAPPNWVAYPVDMNDPKVWHFVLLGSTSSDFEGGMYHGRILLPDEYPLRAPDIVFDTPNGRFELGKKICLSATAFHQESWQPAWGIRTLMDAIQAFMVTDDTTGSVGAITVPGRERRRLAQKSTTFFCSTCKLLNKEIAREHNLRQLDISMLTDEKARQVDNRRSGEDSRDEKSKTNEPTTEERIAARTRDPTADANSGVPLGVGLREGVHTLLAYYWKSVPFTRVAQYSLMTFCLYRIWVLARTMCSLGE